MSVCFFLLLEAALMVYRIGTKSMQRRATAILRGASALALAALAIWPEFAWGFGDAALVGAFAASAAVNALKRPRGKEVDADFRRAHSIRRAAAMSTLIVIASLPAIVFPEYKPLPTTGKYQIKTEVRHFADESRIETDGAQRGARMLAVEFWHPENAQGRFPLVVFSHGSFGTRASNETLFRELASHGYVVCSIDHTHQCFYTTDEDGSVLLMDRGYAGEIRRENAREDKQNSLMLYRKWMRVRVADINFVIDAIQADPADALTARISAGKIGVIGHSLGGSAALGVGRVRDDIGAVVALEAPFMCDILRVEGDAFIFERAQYPVPVLNVYSDSSWAHLDQWPQYAKNAQLLFESHEDAYNLHIAGAGHLSLTDLSLASPLITRLLNGRASSITAEDCLTRINAACLNFFDRFLKADDGAAAFPPAFVYPSEEPMARPIVNGVGRINVCPAVAASL